MPTNIPIKSFNQILGDMMRTIFAQTPLTDLNAGSVLLTLLEAAAANDFENNTAILNILELLSIDAVRNSDLDNRAADYGLTRDPAQKTSGPVNILQTLITKQSTSFYVLNPAPVSGQTVIYVNNTTGWAASGTLYIGRGTPNFEGPIAYSSITVFPTFSQINLSSALQNNHLISETVINAQGQLDQVIPAGTVVVIPANNLNPQIEYTTLRDAILPAGETIITGVQVTAVTAGSAGNAGLNTITQFNTIPFIGAGVTNTTSFINGSDIETDDQLRNRIKNYATTLARGTAASIIAQIIGVSDPDDNKQVASASITEPVAPNEPSILYIDDGTGFQPSYAGQSVDVLLANANGTEQFLQLSNYPVTRPQVVNAATVSTFNLTNGSFIRVVVDGVSETVVFNTNEFNNISSATLAEIIVAINSNSTLFNARFTNNSQNILLYPVAANAERLQVSELLSSDDPALYANTMLLFPTQEVSYIALFQNSDRLRSEASSATLQTGAFGSWNISAPGNIIISVDGTPVQNRTFLLSDFPGATSFSSLSLQNWVDAFNTQFAGITAAATSSETMSITSNRVGSSSSLVVEGGTYFNNWFSNLPTSATGQTSQFLLNRQTGNLEILTKIQPGDSITAGVADARGFTLSTATVSGTYNLSTDSAGRPALMIVVPDSTFCDIRTVVASPGETLSITNPSGSVMRIMSDAVGTFVNLLPGDFLYITPRSSSWLNINNTGLFKLIDKGGHTTAGVDTFVDVENVSVVPQASIVVIDSLDVQAFGTDGYPQIFNGVYTSNPPADTITDFANTLNSALLNVNASIFKSNSVKLTSTTELNGSIAIPVSVGLMLAIFPVTALQTGNPPLIANRASSKSLMSYFKPTATVSANVWLNRQTYTDQRGALTANAVPDSYPWTGGYSEQIQSTGELNNSNVDFEDYILFTRGNNRGQFRTIAAFPTTDTAGTQEGIARTALNHTIGDEFEIMEPIQLSAQDTMTVVLDQNPTDNTITTNMWRTGEVNSGSSSMTFAPTTTEFSANDYDNQPGVDFGNATIWGTTINSTDFSDYTVQMRARNWYSAGGLTGGQGQMIVRAAEYGANGNDLRFSLSYPSIANQSPNTVYMNTPSYSQLTYVFGSGAARPIAVNPGTTISVSGPYPDTATNFPSGAASTGYYYDYHLSAGNFGTVMVGDVLSITTGSGVTSVNSGQFSITNLSGTTVRVFNPVASTTGSGRTEITTATTVADINGSLNGTYFLVYDRGGAVAVWYDVDDRGTAEPYDAPAYKSIRVGTVVSNDTAATIATKTATAVNADALAAFTVAAVSNTMTITSTFEQNVSPGITAGTSGFAVAVSQTGQLNAPETITNPNGVSVFPLAGNTVATIVSTVNAGEILQLVAYPPSTGGSAVITKATREDIYSYTSNSTALAYNQAPYTIDPTRSGFISLYDGINWVKKFQNANPNFTMKTAFTLNGVAPSIYEMDTTPNPGITTTGELFKLIPTSVKNVYHQFTQKALSQLPIISTVDISNDRKNVQITSKNLGSAGAVEVVGGTANSQKSYIKEDAEVVTDASGNYLLIKTQAFPDTWNAGDEVMLTNDVGVTRFSRLQASDRIDVTSSTTGIFEYNYDPKAINTSAISTFTITDVSSIYSKPSGFIWRWTASNDVSFSSVNAGDLVYAFGTTIPWAQGNQVGLAGNGYTAGLPIIDVNSSLQYIDVVNPNGSAMSSTAVGSGNTVQICPTPVIKWNLAHKAQVQVTTLNGASNVITVTTATPYTMNTGDSFTLADSLAVPDGTYGPITTLSPTQFTFAHTIANFTESSVGASVIKSGVTPTRYRLEKLNVNGLVRIQRYDGASPQFTACGVAVDDYVTISGNTFQSNNSGTYRVLAVDSDTMLIMNNNATDELNTTVSFNNNNFEATWTSNTNTVTGVAGTFKYVNVGDWVKQSTDPDSLYVQVNSMSPSTPDMATTITLGETYGGTTAIAPGVIYDELNNYDKGVYLLNTGDIAVYEGDAALAGDNITIQNIVNTNWFLPGNIGTFGIVATGTNTSTYKPFIRVDNTLGIVQSNALMSVNVGGVYVTESLTNKFYTIRKVSRATINDVNQSYRSLYITPFSRAYKFTVSNKSNVIHMGKLGYNTNIDIGIDGYTYYTGLLQKVQHLVDGWEPDSVNYPGLRAVGGLIETLPPLVNEIKVALTVTTNNGINLGDITNNIKSAVISYIESLSVGQNVILSEIIAQVMSINGVQSVIFVSPSPSQAIITIANNEKAIIIPDNITVS